MNGKSMTEGQPWKHILKFALPILAGSLLQQLYNTVDTIIVGKYYGEDALSAVGTMVSFTFLFLALALGFSSGNGIVVAQYYGANDENRSEPMRQQGSSCYGNRDCSYAYWHSGVPSGICSLGCRTGRIIRADFGIFQGIFIRFDIPVWI